MQMIYADESGELGLHPNSSKNFIVTMITTSTPKPLKNALKNEKKKLYKLGWPPDLEIKGTSLWGSDRNSDVPNSISDNKITIIRRILSKITDRDTAVHYCHVDKRNLTDAMKQAPYGVVYNICSGLLVGEIFEKHTQCDMKMIIDRRSKESHDWAHFDGYVTTKIVADYGYSGELNISHEESDKILGLQAVDFISWSLFRKIEHNDSQFCDLIDPHCKVMHAI